MGDRRRFALMANLVSERFPYLKHAPIADVAGGKGYLQMALRQNGFTNIVSWDKRPKYSKRRPGYRYRWFNFNVSDRYELVVAMHPDEGTDHSILYAAKNAVPFVVCPCCVLPSATAYYGSRSNFNGWVNHLLSLTKGLVEQAYLPMNGRNLVLIGGGS